VSGVAEVALGDVASVVRTMIEPSEIGEGTFYVGLENITSGGGFNGVAVLKPGEVASTKFVFSKHEVLFGKLRPYLAKVARPHFGGVCSTDILPIAPGPGLNRDYLAHFLSQPATIALAAQRATGANLPRLSPKELEKFRLPLPSVEEQRRIARVLDAADALRAKRRDALSRVGLLSEAYFLEMFGDPVTNPMGWGEGAVLGDLADVMGGITKGRKLKSSVVLRQVPYLAVSNVQDRRLDLSTVKTICATPDEVERYRLVPGDLLLTEGGDPDKLGRGTLWNGALNPCLHQNHIFRVRITNRNVLDAQFLSWQIASIRGRRYFLRAAKQTTGIATINKTQLSSFPLFLPPIDLQKKFSSSVTSVASLQGSHSRHLVHLDALFASLQDRAFKGEL
jgi:type I restriction enzyme S subunit